MLIQSMKLEHPLWGYRSVWSYLQYRMEYPIGINRVYRIMKEHQLLTTKTQRLLAKRGPYRSKPRATRPNQYWGTDMTKIKISTFGWLYLVIVLDWYTKEIVGYSLNTQSKSDDWLDALHMAINQRFPQGIKEQAGHSLSLISDNGCQPTSLKYKKECAQLDINQIFTTWSNPKGNADTERVIRRIKENLVWPNDWENPFDFADAAVKFIMDYNTDFPHQALKYMTPSQFNESFNKEQVLS
jgi:transposase InsO family protein